MKELLEEIRAQFTVIEHRNKQKQITSRDFMLSLAATKRLTEMYPRIEAALKGATP